MLEINHQLFFILYIRNNIISILLILYKEEFQFIHNY